MYFQKGNYLVCTHNNSYRLFPFWDGFMHNLMIPLNYIENNNNTTILLAYCLANSGLT